ncbi:MAG: glycosyltransferase family 1 protein, partial [Planctomycetia bacterium]|nr:glycosyltransferase family 1 protein [Planctomycetia bacterium]
MAGRKIVYFLAPGGDDRLPLNLAKGVVERSGGRIEVELLSVSQEPGRWSAAPGVSVRRVKAAGHPKDPIDSVSWELVEALAGADLVHLHQAYT